MGPRHGSKESFCVGEILVEPRLNRIVKAGEVCRLEPRVVQVLVHLAAMAGHVVTRDELMKAVWGDVIVSDKALVHAVSALRKALGDDWTHPRYIETISKNGYRLIAPVRELDEAVSPRNEPDLPGDISQPARDSAVHVTRRTGHGAGMWLRGTGARLVAVLVALGLVLLTVIWTVRRSAPSASAPLYGLPATSLAGDESGGVLSPDGQQLAFAWRPPGTKNWDIYVKLVDGENVVRLTSDPDTDDHPAWSPDGQYLAFTRRSAQHCDIYRVPVIGGPELRLGECKLPPLSNLSWSPDGQWLARSDAPSRRKARRILLLNVESGEVHALTRPPEGSQGDTNPVFSPDGRYVAFVRVSSNGLSDLFRISMAGGRVERITFDRRRIYGLDWMPDGREVLFGSDRAGRVALWRVPAEGGEPAVFPVADQQIIFPSLARAVRTLAYTRFTDDTNIWALNLNDRGAMEGVPRLVISSSMEDQFPQVSPDGNRLAFVSRRTGYSELWTSDLDGSNLIRHTQFKGALVASPSWSPDGRKLLFDARVDGQAALYTVGAQERLAVRLTGDRWDELNGTWSRDAAWIYFSSNRSGSWQIWRRPAKGGSAVQMTDHGGFRVLEGPGPSTLYYTKHDTLGLWGNSSALGPESLVIPDLWIGDWSNWAVTDDGIFFVRSDPRALAYFDLATRQSRPVYEASRRIPLAEASSLSLSRNGKTLFYTQIDGGGLDLMLLKEY